MLLVTSSDVAKSGVSYMPSSLAMKEVLPANRDQLDKDKERAGESCASHRWRAEGDLLTPMGVKDTLSHCSNKRALCTVQGARHHAGVVARDAGLLLMSRLPPPTVAGSTVACARNAARRPQDVPQHVFLAAPCLGCGSRTAAGSRTVITAVVFESGP
ncbi:uncharacterized protein LOC125942177 [Dermacentor silvarum]|uniref:uncharacterized protein LOC125942177 n=1 Tax=Dermacentor silvarum TaxID=543639 RepID=UPI002100AB64|nr:uncharacterized protein LOC125942177 [Dermacentor silvarum]